MKDEIKEINIKMPGQILDYVDTKEHLLELFNYITNLQEEKEIIVKDFKEVSEKYFFTKSRNEKAIEYINTHNYPTDKGVFETDLDKRDLINILTGGDEE